MLDQFKAVLNDYVAGRAEFAQLDSSLIDALSEDPSAGRLASAEIDRRVQTGEISMEACSLLRHSITATTGINLPSGGNEDSPPPKLETGSILKGRFVLEDVIGHGGMGLVYKARDLRKVEAHDQNPYIAIKILNDDFRGHPEALKTLQREARRSQTLAHPNIVTVYDFDRDGDTLFMTMEFLEGESLDSTVKKSKSSGIPVGEAMNLIQGMARALHYAHSKGIVHSDFKPGNCFVTDDGEVKVLDFGIARAARRSDDVPADVTLVDSRELAALTPAYASWEMLEGAEPDPRDDIYALGCVAYELLTGRHPYGMQTAVQARARNLSPKRARGLKSRQWKTLTSSLALERHRRCRDVETFVAGISGEAPNRIAFVSGLAAVVFVAVGVAWLVPEYLREQQIETTVGQLTSGEEAIVAEGLAIYSELDVATQGSVLQRAGESLLGYFLGKADSAVDSSEGRYNFPVAESWLAEANIYFSDSAILRDRTNSLAAAKDAVIAELESQFEISLASGRLLATDEDSIVAVLRALSEADPEHPLLSDPRLAAAFIAEASESLESLELGRADQVIEAGMARFQGDEATFAVLLGVRDQLDTARASETIESQIAASRTSLASLDDSSSLAELRAVGPEATNLSRLDPDDPLLANYQERLAGVVELELSSRLESRQWADAAVLIGSVSNILPADQILGWRVRIDETRSEVDVDQRQALISLERSVNDGQIDAAVANFDQMNVQELDPETIAIGRALLEQGFVLAVLDARAAGDPDRAAELVTRGLALIPGSTRLVGAESGLAEAQEVLESGDQDRIGARFAEAGFLVNEFQRILDSPELNAEAAREALDDLDRIADLAPGEELLITGRSDLAAVLASRAQELADGKFWSEAIGLTVEAIALIPESRNLRALNAELVAANNANAALQLQSTIGSHRARINGLFEDPALDDAWRGELTEALDELIALGSDDDFVTEARRQAAELYFDAASSSLDQDQFAEARSNLQAAVAFDAGLGGIAALESAIDEAQRAFQAENAEVARANRIESLRASVLDAAAENNVTAALSALRELEAEIGSDDPFITSTAPEEIGSAYLRIAEIRINSGEFDGAEESAVDGMAELSRLGVGDGEAAAALNDLVDSIAEARLAFNLESLEQLLTSRPPNAAEQSRALELLISVALDAGAAYEVYEAELIAAVEQRIDTADDPGSVRSWAASIFEGEFAAPLDNSGYECMAEMAGQGKATVAREAMVCWDIVDAGERIAGPTMVVIPGGGAFSTPYAIGRYEISIGQWNAYCRLSAACDERFADETLPVTDVEFADARRYARWLSQMSDAVYRVPSGAEWEYAASADRALRDDDDNCDNRDGALRSVADGNPNDWGLTNYVGNAREWVTSDLGPEVQGASFKSALPECRYEHVDPSLGDPDDETGFRVMREL